MKEDPLAPHINEDGRAFNGNYGAIVAAVLATIAIVVALGAAAFA